MRLESSIEARLVRAVARRGGCALKWQGVRGAPDRIVVLPGGRVVFVEVKGDRGRLSPHQTAMLARLTRLGCETAVVRGAKGVDEWLRSL